MTTKVLIAGDARGDVDALFARVGAVHASKGPFDCLLCVGDFFGADPAATLARVREISVPLRTYLIGTPPPAAEGTGAAADADGMIELRPEVYCLSGTGIVTVHGLRLAFASMHNAAAEGAPTLTEAVVELRGRVTDPAYVGCDLLLTHDWPRGFCRQLPEGGVPADVLPERDLPEVGSETVAEIAACVRPRYHFCATEDQFFQRAPYRQRTTAAGGLSVCRLVCLACVGPDKKKKWLHALSLAPMATMAADQLAAATDNTTDSPYPYALALAPPPPPPPGAATGEGGPAAKRQRREFAKEQRSWVSERCWFCMASPQFESHFVVSVGEEVYVCVAKGPMLPMHALLLPVAHTPCSLLLSETEAAELAKYVEALRKCFEARGASLLLFERYTASGNFEHMHLQAIPLPAQLAGSARAAFEAHGRKFGMGFELLPPGQTVADRLGTEPEPFFAATLPSGEVLLHRIRSNPRKHPLQFGREVVANMLGNPRRADWKMCLPQPAPGERISTEQLEARGADEFKQAFAPFDPTPDDE